MRKLSVVFVFMFLLMAVVSCSSAGETAVEPTPTPLPTAVKPTFTVERGEITIRSDLAGRVVPVNSKPAAFEIDGKIGNVYVEVGDKVEEGQLLADLDSLKVLETEWATVSSEAKYEETVSNNTIERAEINLQIAQLALESLKARGANAADVQIAELQERLAQMDLDEIKANPVLHQASARAAELESAMADAQLKSPVAGYVVDAPKPGQAFKAGAGAFQIGDVSELEIGALATEDVLPQLIEGMPVSVVFEGTGNKEKYAGTIRQLPYPYGTGSGSDEVRIVLDKTPEQGGYQLGDRVLISAILQDKSDILVLPPQAIRNIGGRTFVVVQDAAGQRRVDVTLGLQVHDKVEILSGLTDGQVVVGP
jgi:macrolide-specific efflux system membrane fusion protein